MACRAVRRAADCRELPVAISFGLESLFALPLQTVLLGKDTGCPGRRPAWRDPRRRAAAPSSAGTGGCSDPSPGPSATVCPVRLLWGRRGCRRDQRGRVLVQTVGLGEAHCSARARWWHDGYSYVQSELPPVGPGGAKTQQRTVPAHQPVSMPACCPSGCSAADPRRPRRALQWNTSAGRRPSLRKVAICRVCLLMTPEERVAACQQRLGTWTHLSAVRLGRIRGHDPRTPATSSARH